jgi:hypothetical protein
MWFLVIPPDGAARAVALACAASFSEQLPGNVVAFDTKRYGEAWSEQLRRPDANLVTDALNQSLAVQCLDSGAQYLCVFALAPVTLFTLNLLRRQGVTTVHWFFEDWRSSPYWKSVVEGYDLFLAVQRGKVEQTCREKEVRFALIPTAASVPAPPSSRPNEKPRVDVAFVGIPSAYRIDMLDTLAASGHTLAIGGQGWSAYRGPLRPSVVSGDWVDATGCAAMLRSACVGLNLSADDPSSSRAETHLSPRVFDVLGQGTALLTEDVPLAQEILAGYTYEVFEGKRDVALKVREVSGRLSRQELEANAKSVRDRDTYAARVKKIRELAEGARATTALRGTRMGC